MRTDDAVRSFAYFEAQRNSDQTEGKGHSVVIAAYDNEPDAVQRVKGEGVMGVGDGDVVAVIVTYHSDHRVVVKREKTYGYRKDWQGHWNYGYLDNRDAPINDPDYHEYLRLKRKFGSK